MRLHSGGVFTVKLREKMARENAHVAVCIVRELYVSSCLFVWVRRFEASVHVRCSSVMVTRGVVGVRACVRE